MGYAFSAMSYVLKRIVQRFEETALTSEDYVRLISAYEYSSKSYES